MYLAKQVSKFQSRQVLQVLRPNILSYPQFRLNYSTTMPESTSPVRREFTIRTAKSKDVEAIASLGSRVFAASFGYSLSSADLEAYLKSAYSNTAVTADISNPNIDTIVATDSHDHVVGFSQLTRSTTEPCLAGVEKTVELQRLYVSEDCHGAGIGKKLANRVEEMAREQGFVTIWLGVWEENFKAQKVYKKLGYVKVGEHDFKMGDCVQTDWIMSKKL
ncbi:acyl-CoA N-acyltransferase [Leptodontidium sp. MPI-SDFR-AT-0119]|nr:acyl-CoA N-acyltransferase [Leptodontidium sp. MPI-SDFR-AT-0119]